MTIKTCNNCWWFSHINNHCFRTAEMKKIEAPKYMVCTEWAFDGLADWEREDCEALTEMDITR